MFQTPSLSRSTGSQASPRPLPSESTCDALAITEQLSVASGTPSLSSSLSEQSGCASPSVLGRKLLNEVFDVYTCELLKHRSDSRTVQFRPVRSTMHEISVPDARVVSARAHET